MWWNMIPPALFCETKLCPLEMDQIYTLRFLKNVEMGNYLYKFTKQFSMQIDDIVYIHNMFLCNGNICQNEIICLDNCDEIV